SRSSVIPQPCIGPRRSTLRTIMSSVPCSRSSRLCSATHAPYGGRKEVTVTPFDCQGVRPPRLALRLLRDLHENVGRRPPGLARELADVLVLGLRALPAAG